MYVCMYVCMVGGWVFMVVYMYVQRVIRMYVFNLIVFISDKPADWWL